MKIFRIQKLVTKLEMIFLLLCSLVLKHGSVSTVDALTKSGNSIRKISTPEQQNGESKGSFSSETMKGLYLFSKWQEKGLMSQVSAVVDSSPAPTKLKQSQFFDIDLNL